MVFAFQVSTDQDIVFLVKINYKVAAESFSLKDLVTRMPYFSRLIVSHGVENLVRLTLNGT